MIEIIKSLVDFGELGQKICIFQPYIFHGKHMEWIIFPFSWECAAEPQHLPGQLSGHDINWCRCGTLAQWKGPFAWCKPWRLLTDRCGHKIRCVEHLTCNWGFHTISYPSSTATQLQLALVGLPNSSLCCRYIGSGAIRSGAWWCCVRKSLKVTGSAIIACVLDWPVYQFLFAGPHRPFGRALWCLFLLHFRWYDLNLYLAILAHSEVSTCPQRKNSRPFQHGMEALGHGGATHVRCVGTSVGRQWRRGATVPRS